MPAFSEVEMMRSILRFPILFLGLTALFVLALTLAFAIPNQAVEWHQEYSMVVLDIEEKWESLGNRYGLFGVPGMPDNSADRSMIRRTIVEHPEKGAYRSAMHMNGYFRYWHGYQAVLRPLLVFFQIHQIRFINGFVFYGLLFAIFLLLYKKSRVAPWLFLLVMCFCPITEISPNLHYMSTFVPMLCAMVYVLLKNPQRDTCSLSLFFMAVGMCTSYFDLLSTPLITLGMPLCLCLYLTPDEERFSASFRKLVFSVLAWGLGYGLCWAAKWLLAFFAGESNVVQNAMGHGAYWLSGQNGGVDRMHAVLYNFRGFFLQHGIRSLFFPGIALLALCFLVLRYHMPVAGCVRKAALFLPVILCPYMWYFLMAEHSIHHQWFTFRVQIITLFGIYLMLLSMVDRKRLPVRFLSPQETE